MPHTAGRAITQRPRPRAYQATAAGRCPLCNEGSMRPLEILLPQGALRAGPSISLSVAALEGDTS